jgi:putative ABC transport system permease protein
MSLIGLVFVNLMRNKRRTILTLLSVTVALFLFCALGGVLDTLQESIKVGSESRLVTRNKISLVVPHAAVYRERIAAVPGVKGGAPAVVRRRIPGPAQLLRPVRGRPDLLRDL